MDEGDAVLCQLFDEDITADTVQETKRHIMAAIEIEQEANASLSWKLFLTMGFIDNTKLKVVRRLVICFWIPILGRENTTNINNVLIHLLTYALRWGRGVAG